MSRTRYDDILDQFANLWEISFNGRGPIDRDHPIRFSVEDAELGRKDVEFRAWVYRRYNGVEVVRIDVDTDKVEFADVRGVERWVTGKNGRLPFATIRVRADERRTVHLTVTHSLLAESITSAQIRQVVDSMYHVWEQCTSMLDELEPLVEECYEFADQSLDAEDNTIDLDADDPDGESLNDQSVDSAIVPGDEARIIEGDDSVDAILAELNALIGLEPVKALVRQLAAQQSIAKRRKEHGLNAVLPSPHLVFLGNPGTGKTTVARLVGRLYKAFGLVAKGHVVEADRSSLVAGYIGQTAIKTREMCRQALGGVLFIDEAYSLNVDGRDYGTEAIETLLTFMEAHRGEFAVVVAGYPDKMVDFLASNPGLKSRFDVSLSFPDYTTDELMRIFADLVAANDYVFDAEAHDKAEVLIQSWVRGPGFGNAREVRRLFHHVVGVQAAMLAEESVLNTDMLRQITEEMIPDPVHDDAQLVPAGPANINRFGGYL